MRRIETFFLVFWTIKFNGLNFQVR